MFNNSNKKLKWQVKKQGFLQRIQRHWPRFLLMFAVVAVVLLPWAGPQSLRFVGGFLDFESVGEEPADYAIVLGGEFPHRVLEAARLYKEGKVKRILLSRGFENVGLRVLQQLKVSTAPAEQSRNHRVLKRLGVPASKISRFKVVAQSSAQEAQVMRDWLVKKGIGEKDAKSLIVVTSKTHTKRAHMVFSERLADLVQVGVKGARLDGFSSADWWKRRRFLREVVIEYEKMLFWLLSH